MTARLLSSRGALPPFGKRLVEARKTNGSVNCFIYAGERCFDLARRREHAIALPDDVDWRRADWSIVRGLGVTLVSRGWSLDTTCDLARYLIRAGAEMVAALAVTRDGEIPTVESRYFRPKREAVAA